MQAWNIPLYYGSDSLLVMSWVKSSADGNYQPLLWKKVPELGAPFVANWNDYPVTEDTLMFCIGVLARFIGLFAACNLAVLGAQLLAGISFYGVCRWLGMGFPGGRPLRIFVLCGDRQRAGVYGFHPLAIYPASVPEWKAQRISSHQI